EIVPVQARALLRRRAVGPDDVGEIAAAGTGLDPEIAVFQVRPQPGLELMLAGAMGDESLRRLGHGHLLPVPAAARPRRRALRTEADRAPLPGSGRGRARRSATGTPPCRARGSRARAGQRGPAG